MTWMEREVRTSGARRRRDGASGARAGGARAGEGPGVLRYAVAVVWMAAAASVPGCAPIPGPGSEFTLVDINPASTTFAEPVSPRDYLEAVSGWYFGEAT